VSLAAVTADAASGAPATQFQPFKIGGYSAVALKDGGIVMRSTARVLSSASRTRRSVRCSRRVGLPPDHFEFSIQPLLVHAGVHVLLFDTGAGGFSATLPASYRSSMTAAGEKPASVTDIFISHAHGDHIGGLLTSTGALAFPMRPFTYPRLNGNS